MYQTIIKISLHYEDMNILFRVSLFFQEIINLFQQAEIILYESGTCKLGMPITKVSASTPYRNYQVTA